MENAIIKEFRELSDSEITVKIEQMRSELFQLRFQQATRQLSKTHLFRETRLKLAQLSTIQSERMRSAKS